MSRTKDQWISETGGFRVGETQEMFQRRMESIQVLRDKISDGAATAADVNELAILLGADQDED